ncbi:LytTR family DNA-binding domain-containing protein [Emticicia sp. BO119]|uniref:LytR/AlgR family response regulator transcription factor n=1 Tax=Emticicia sp. BO119 TaxID=2757768 RepID=UPI0015F0FABB|nr:LytTR family DNA-binding domain-containing protein [Emticicia sp. BO119]MBA4851102.1 response regulator transcription factor [Emticicia sp. BO119]
MTILIVEKTEDNFKLIAEVLAEYYPMSDLIHCQSIQQTLAELAVNDGISLGFFEVELADGLSFEIFQQINVAFPVVFMSAYDKYWSQAMPLNAIDYLRKPIEKTEVMRVLDKYETLGKHFLQAVIKTRPDYKGFSAKDRLTVKKGTNYYVMKTDEVAFIYTESRVVFLIDKTGERYIIEKNLSELELELPNRQFFRVNRKFIVSIDAIRSFKPSFKGKIALELMHLSKAEVSISQENAAQFRKWIEG